MRLGRLCLLFLLFIVRQGIAPAVLAQPNPTLFLVNAEGETIEGRLAIGQSFSIVVLDEDQNLDGFIQEWVVVTVQSPGGSPIAIELFETSPNSGRFESGLLNSSMIEGLVLIPGQELLFVYQAPDDPEDVVFLQVIVMQDGHILEPGVHRELIIVKFHEGTGIRLREGQFVSLTGFDTYFLNNVLNRHSPLQIQRLYEEAEEELDRQRSELQFEPGPPLEDFNLFFLIRLTFISGSEFLLNELRILNVVEDARYYQHPLVFVGEDVDEQVIVAASGRPRPLASAGSLQTPDLSASQGYLGPAPTGVDAYFAHTIPGGKGEGIRVVDMEQGWNLNHEDINCCFYKEGAFPKDGDAVNHGTAVLGVIAGRDDGAGVLGIAPAAALGVVSWADGLVAPRMKRAVGQLRKGDVLLLEGQIARPGNPDACSFIDRTGCLPLEIDPANFNEINYAVKSGIVVVEAAGNSRLNLDDPQTYGGQLEANLSKHVKDFEDSGALLVGAGYPPGQYPADKHVEGRARADMSNFGSRLDVQGWGRLVATSGGPKFVAPWYSNLYDGGLNRQYTKSFAGTSSASAMVAGVVAALQGIRKGQGKPLLTSREMRDLLVYTGTPQAEPQEQIGPLPNLRAATQWLIGPSAAPVPPSPPPSVTSPVNLVDLDNDGFINDQEVQLAIQWWIAGTPIPNTEIVISDEDIKAIVHAWITNSPVSTLRTAKEATLEIPFGMTNLSLVSHKGGFAVHAAGLGIQRLELEVFNLAGDRLVMQSAIGDTLRFTPMDFVGRRWANGVYLYVVTAYGADHAIERSGIRKMMLLN